MDNTKSPGWPTTRRNLLTGGAVTAAVVSDAPLIGEPPVRWTIQLERPQPFPAA
jgi:hypothetical protein